MFQIVHFSREIILKVIFITSIVLCNTAQGLAQDGDSLAKQNLSAALFNLSSNFKVDTSLGDAKKPVLFLDTKYAYNLDYVRDNIKQDEFKLMQARVYFAGDINSKISFAIRYKLYNPSGVNALELANLTYGFNDHLRLSVGQQFIAWGGFELSRNSSDLYMLSSFYNSADLIGQGLALTYQYKKQSFKVQLLNSPNSFSSQAQQNKSFGLVGLWEGNLFNSVLKTRYSYGVFNYSATKYYSTFMVGNQVNALGMSLELDYIYSQRDLRDANFDLPQQDYAPQIVEHIAIAHLRYPLGRITPSIKAMYNYRKDVASNQGYYRNGLSMVLEYYPFTQKASKDFRVFTGYTLYDNVQHDNFSTMDLNNEQQFTMGVRWMIPIL